MNARPRKHRRLSAQAVEMVADRFRILGEPFRIRILQELQDGDRNVSDLVEAVGSSQPNISKHLRILQQAGMVERRQEGNQVYYFIADPTVFDLCDAVCTSLGQRLARDARLVPELHRGL